MMMIDRSARRVESRKTHTTNNHRPTHPRCSRIHKPCSFGVVWFGRGRRLFGRRQVYSVRFGPIRFDPVRLGMPRDDFPLDSPIRCMLRYNSPSAPVMLDWVCPGTVLVRFCIFRFGSIHGFIQYDLVRFFTSIFQDAARYDLDCFKTMLRLSPVAIQFGPVRMSEW